MPSTTVPSYDAVLQPETLLKRRQTNDKQRQEKIAKAAELKKVSSLISSPGHTHSTAEKVGHGTGICLCGGTQDG